MISHGTSNQRMSCRDLQIPEAHEQSEVENLHFLFSLQERFESRYGKTNHRTIQRASVGETYRTIVKTGQESSESAFPGHLQLAYRFQ